MGNKTVLEASRAVFSVFCEVRRFGKTIVEKRCTTVSTPPIRRLEKTMRLLIVPFILVAILVQTPAPVLGSPNQEAAEKIANTIGERFPNADIDVAYQGGRVRLQGEAGSQEQRTQILEHVRNIAGINVTDVNDDIQIAAPKAIGIPARTPAQAARTPVRGARPAASPLTAPVPMPAPAAGNAAPMIARQAQPAPPQTFAGAMLAPYPQQQYPAAYGMNPGQQSAVPAPYAPTSYAVPGQQAMPQQYQQPAYGPQGQMAYHPEAYGPQGPLPGQYNQPNLPNYAWPAYANYPNYAQVSYPRAYSPKAWPYIGPFYPYPQVPLGWRKVTLEHDNGYWWLDFDDGTPSGPFSGLFRQAQQYRY